MMKNKYLKIEAVKKIAEIVSKQGYGYYTNNHSRKSIENRLKIKSLNCTDGLRTDDELEYQKWLTERYKKKGQ